MAVKKYKNRAINALQDEEDDLKPGERPFFFSSRGVTIYARNMEEAIKKLNKLPKK